jgi:septal ring factor EnvC (AmiA/AmiB activator)
MGKKQRKIDELTGKLERAKDQGYELLAAQMKLEKLELELADVKAAWSHDKKERDKAEKERDDLRRQLSKVREAHTKEHEALYPKLGNEPCL